MSEHEKKPADPAICFGPYRLDLVALRLWRGTQAVKLTGKAFAVLRHFVEHARQLVTKDALFHAVWAETVVSDATLASCIQELRQALRDNAKKPRYIETVHRRGYQWIAPLTATPQPVQSPRSQVQSQNFEPAPSPQSLTPSFVGREAELAQLHQWLEKALNGERQLVFVTGEPGIGKTTVVEAFLSQVAANGNVWIGRGQCVEHYGAGEAYLPVLEALGRLCRGPEGEHLIALLHQHAPTWLVQMPALLGTVELEEIQRRTAGVTRERMLRELAEALEALTAERALILCLEDLHWSDYSTLDLLSILARRQEGARLLILGTYRPVEVLLRDHPLKGIKQELQLHGQCEELALGFLSEGDVAT
jgi:DNA-binding winged helix-turn-helix (wHTH) protein